MSEDPVQTETKYVFNTGTGINHLVTTVTLPSCDCDDIELDVQRYSVVIKRLKYNVQSTKINVITLPAEIDEKHIIASVSAPGRVVIDAPLKPKNVMVVQQNVSFEYNRPRVVAVESLPTTVTNTIIQAPPVVDIISPPTPTAFLVDARARHISPTRPVAITETTVSLPTTHTTVLETATPPPGTIFLGGITPSTTVVAIEKKPSTLKDFINNYFQ